MKIEPTSSIDQIKNILASCSLPTEDIDASTAVKFFGIYHGEVLAAIVGLELYAGVGLLRSLAVLPEQRGTGAGKALVQHAEAVALQHGVEQLYLLTTTAEPYFLRLGYNLTPREKAPEPIQATSQFSGLCPASSAFLVKQLNT